MKSEAPTTRVATALILRNNTSTQYYKEYINKNYNIRSRFNIRICEVLKSLHSDH